MQGSAPLLRLRGYRPGLVGGAVVVAALILGHAGAGVILRAVGIDGWLLSSVARALAFVVLFALWCALTARAPGDVIRPRDARAAIRTGAAALPLIALGVGYGFLSPVLLTGSSLAVSSVPAWPEVLGLGALVPMLLVFGVTGPFIEEVVFRGIVLHGLLARHRPWIAIALSALLFALAHLDPARLPGLFVAGCLYGWLYHVFRSVTPAWIVHGLSNTVPILFALMPFGVAAAGLVAALPTVVWAVIVIRRRSLRAAAEPERHGAAA